MAEPKKAEGMGRRGEGRDGEAGPDGSRDGDGAGISRLSRTPESTLLTPRGRQMRHFATQMKHYLIGG